MQSCLAEKERISEMAMEMDLSLKLNAKELHTADHELVLVDQEKDLEDQKEKQDHEQAQTKDHDFRDAEFDHQAVVLLDHQATAGEVDDDALIMEVSMEQTKEVRAAAYIHTTLY